MENGKLIIFSAPSGSGKTTIVKHLLATNSNLGFSISACTRDKRGRNEENGKDYYFMTPDEFKQKIVGAVVVNKTGMEEYIPENILVYIATHNGFRGKGIGKALMKAVIQNCSGDIALHVEASNPARFLYSKLGFENPYLEMRLKR